MYAAVLFCTQLFLFNMEVSVTIAGKLLKLRKRVLESPGVMSLFLRQAAAEYSRAVQARFDKLAAGGSGDDPGDGIEEGPWAPLSPSTLGGHSRRNVLILVRSGLLRQAVRAGSGVLGSVSQGNGAVFEMSATFHQDFNYPEGGLTTADVLGFHQRGGPNLPQRKILFKPRPGGPLMQKLHKLGRDTLVAAVNS